MAAPNGLFTSSPTVVLPPAQSAQHFANGRYATSASDDQMLNGFENSLLPHGSIPPTPGSLAGRKRSRGDIHAPEDEEESLEDGSISTPAGQTTLQSRGEPMYGPGMTLIYPDDPGYEARPESQSGTWVEEREELKWSELTNMKRPSINTRKLQRMDSAASVPNDLAQLVLPSGIRDVTSEPLIDEATRALGISWTRMDGSEALQIRQAAYSKWIQNHYPSLREVSIWFENSALPAYLVFAQNALSNEQEYYVFSHDLTEARLVTNDPSQLVPRLQMLPSLELAAPGGHIRAEAELITASQPEASRAVEKDVQSSINGSPAEHGRGHNRVVSYTDDGFMMNAMMLRGMYCSAHDMEMD